MQLARTTRTQQEVHAPSGLNEASAEIATGRAGANHQEAHVLFLSCGLVRVGGLGSAEESVFLVGLNKSMAISSRGRPRVTRTHRPHTLARRLKSISEPDSPPEETGFELMVPLADLGRSGPESCNVIVTPLNLDRVRRLAGCAWQPWRSRQRPVNGYFARCRNPGGPDGKSPLGREADFLRVSVALPHLSPPPPAPQPFDDIIQKCSSPS